MCTTCGCSNKQSAAVTDLDAQEAAQAQPREESGSPQQPQSAAVAAHEHLYRRVDGHGHTHPHPHPHPHPHDQARPHSHEHEHEHENEHEHDQVHVHAHEHGTSITLEQEILAKNQLLAERNRGWLAGRSILAVNLMSSPGAGKTTLLERTIRETGGTMPLTVIEGDQATLNDAERIRATGCRVVQINTGTGCHLDAEMIFRGLKQLEPPLRSVVMIENVGNLVCPALFDLGELAKVLILSVTEGEDKPIKYPHMFRASSLMLLNKIDLLPYLRFDVARCIDYARRVNPAIDILQISAETGAGMEAWYAWLRDHRDTLLR
ncbi:hydrogenase accessory protein HypB [Paraburkholderia ginsengiterrae]|uniref:Hydrogenase maturation factor HypB n=1 Tax=Paraburkholderia ginsengiterrae TaxID=1462993 RepID=A0A1A9NB04_9BURK|nr:hydrogenase nickel incorporation protein HypB [Paraburkholderia ginsengiterrae]OAJ59437.1 hydrogenase accessory protein HypB [Paraburkholderia ginsengiterrae]OAJ63350.1 hydrogenase accessory protein HypB [Paraburkholderia ginsengiterrae]